MTRLHPGQSRTPSGEQSDLTPASDAARDVKALLREGRRDEARDRFGAVVDLLQRKALRIAYQYVRDAADADDAVQDAFIKVFLHIEHYREELPFDLWFTRVLVNTCLDRLKARARQQKWVVSPAADEGRADAIDQVPSREVSSEDRLLARERWTAVSAAVAELPERQRLVFTLSHSGERSAAEIGAATGMSPATVRVHLFRAIRKLRGLLKADA